MLKMVEVKGTARILPPEKFYWSKLPHSKNSAIVCDFCCGWFYENEATQSKLGSFKMNKFHWCCSESCSKYFAKFEPDLFSTTTCREFQKYCGRSANRHLWLAYKIIANHLCVALSKIVPDMGVKLLQLSNDFFGLYDMNESTVQLWRTTLLNSNNAFEEELFESFSFVQAMFSHIHFEKSLECGWNKWLTIELWSKTLILLELFSLSTTLECPSAEIGRNLPLIQSTRKRRAEYMRLLKHLGLDDTTKKLKANPASSPPKEVRISFNNVPATMIAPVVDDNIERRIAAFALSSALLDESNPFDHLACPIIALLPPKLAKLPHSCLPNMHFEIVQTKHNDVIPRDAQFTGTDKEIEGNFSGLEIRMTALRDIPFPLNTSTEDKFKYYTVSWLDPSERNSNHERRSQLLRRRRQLFRPTSAGADETTDEPCSCERCRFEMNANNYFSMLRAQNSQCLLSGSNNFELFNYYCQLKSTKDLADYYLSQSQGSDSIFIYLSLLQLRESAEALILQSLNSQAAEMPFVTLSEMKAFWGDVLHALGAALFDQGNWVQAHFVWAKAHRMEPLHSGLCELSEKLEKYTSWDSNNVSNSLSCKVSSLPIRDDFCEVRLSRNDGKSGKLSCVPRLLGVDTSAKPPPANIYVSKRPLLSASECQLAIELAESYANTLIEIDDEDAKSNDNPETKKKTKLRGWTTARHYSVPTTDIPITAIPELLDWFNRIFEQVLCPMLRVQYFGDFVDDSTKLTNNRLRISVHDAFLVKYHCPPGSNTEMIDRTAKDSQVVNHRENKAVDDVMTSKGNEEHEEDVPAQRFLPLHSDQSTHSFTIALNSWSEYGGGGTYFADLDESIRPDVGHILSFQGELLHAGDPINWGTRYIIAGFMLLDASASDCAKSEDCADSFEYLEEKYVNKRNNSSASSSSSAIHQVFNSSKKRKAVDSAGEGNTEIATEVDTTSNVSSVEEVSSFSFSFF